MIVRYNKIHHNYGSGLWWDGGNRNADIRHNVISDNYRWGIRWEISYGGARIHHNKLTGNGVGDGTMNYHNGQIVISNSDGSEGGIEIYENRIAGIAHAVTIADNSERAIQTKNVYVHDNLIMLRGDDSRVGAAASSGTELFSAASNNRFEDNTYNVPDRRGLYWVWNGETLSWTEWRPTATTSTVNSERRRRRKLCDRGDLRVSPGGQHTLQQLFDEAHALAKERSEDGRASRGRPDADPRGVMRLADR